MPDLVCLREFGSRVHAELACEILASHGIATSVFADDGGGVFEGVLFSSGVAKLMVMPTDRDEAEAVLAAHETESE